MFSIMGLGTVLIASLSRSRRYVPLADLEPGLRLGDDLVNASGAVLLREGEVLGADEIQRIRKHDAVDPLVFLICVYPDGETTG